MILLASSGSFLTEFDTSFLSKPVKHSRVAWITTASKDVEDTSYIERHRQQMTDQDINFEEIDIDGLTKKDLQKRLNAFDIIFVDGGNTFFLLKAMRASGFGEVMRDLLSRGVVYVGASAGSYVACPTIEMATWKHQDRYDHHGVTDFTALNLVPFLVSAHYDPIWMDLLKQKIKTSTFPVKLITDNQAILVDNGTTQLVGTGDEIKLNV